MPKRVLAVSVVCERDKDAAAKLPGLSEILKPICPDLDCTVIDNTGFLDIRNCEVLETFYTKCMAQPHARDRNSLIFP